ncbi:hypothetical protein [Candidatus Uabimicrobium amorphum]|uniref:DNA repair protein RadA n=1 Tax=Uabimicrobium amorphum TaxID=2596890 RepID=A0A5S9F4P0_UABAM|nr:hypothetical protein [Candidatus Uabimicrobium amorphum]BBM84432.1 DNA repair protein RadA [Candidatus Uabimicrobium amorphum]
MRICLGCNEEVYGVSCCGLIIDLESVLGITSNDLTARNTTNLEQQRRVDEHYHDHLFDDYHDEENLVSTDIAFETEVQENYIKGFEFLGSLPKKYRLMIHGLPGSGKSTFSLMFANRISNAHSKTLYLCVEEGAKSATMLKKIKQMRIRNKHLYLFHSNNEDEIYHRIASLGISNVVVDSANRGHIPLEFLIRLYEHIAGVLVYTMHSTKDGKHRGGTEFAHECDIEVRVTKGVAQTLKNRHGELASYQIFKKVYKNGSHRCKRQNFTIVPD